MRRFALLLVLVALGFLPGLCLAQPQASRIKFNFNSDWRVFVGDPQGAEQPAFDDSQWKRVTTPYAWNEDSAFSVSIHDLPVGVAWYRKHFRLPASSAGQKVFIEFEGIRQAGEVYLNGQFIGRHEDGVMAFGFDISNVVKPAPAENVLAVRTDRRCRSTRSLAPRVSMCGPATSTYRGAARASMLNRRCATKRACPRRLSTRLRSKTWTAAL